MAAGAGAQDGSSSSSTNISDNTVNVVHSQQGNCSSLQVVQTGENNDVGSNNGNGNGNIVLGGAAPRPVDGVTPATPAAPGGGSGTNVSVSTNNGNGNGNGNGITISQKAANCNTINVTTPTKTVTKQVVVPKVVRQTQTKTVVVPQTRTIVVQQAPVAQSVTTTAHFTG